MAMGMDMVVNALIKATGVDPELIKTKAVEMIALADQAQPMLQKLIDWNVKTLSDMDARVRANEIATLKNAEALDAIREQNTQIIALLNGGAKHIATTETLVIENEE